MLPEHAFDLYELLGVKQRPLLFSGESSFWPGVPEQGSHHSGFIQMPRCQKLWGMWSGGIVVSAKALLLLGERFFYWVRVSTAPLKRFELLRFSFI